MITDTGSFLINTALLTLTGATLVYTIVYSSKEFSKKDKAEKRQYKEIKRDLRVGRCIVKGLSLAITLYGMYTSTNSVSPLSIIFTTLLIIVWLISVLFEVFAWVVEKEVEYFMTGLNYDLTLGEERDRLANAISKTKGVNPNKTLEELKKLVEEERKHKNAQQLVGVKLKK